MRGCHWDAIGPSGTTSAEVRRSGTPRSRGESPRTPRRARGRSTPGHERAASCRVPGTRCSLPRRSWRGGRSRSGLPPRRGAVRCLHTAGRAAGQRRPRRCATAAAAPRRAPATVPGREQSTASARPSRSARRRRWSAAARTRWSPAGTRPAGTLRAGATTRCWNGNTRPLRWTERGHIASGSVTDGQVVLPGPRTRTDSMADSVATVAGARHLCSVLSSRSTRRAWRSARPRPRPTRPGSAR